MWTLLSFWWYGIGESLCLRGGTPGQQTPVSQALPRAKERPWKGTENPSEPRTEFPRADCCGCPLPGTLGWGTSSLLQVSQEDEDQPLGYKLRAAQRRGLCACQKLIDYPEFELRGPPPSRMEGVILKDWPTAPQPQEAGGRAGRLQPESQLFWQSSQEDRVIRSGVLWVCRAVPTWKPAEWAFLKAECCLPAKVTHTLSSSLLSAQITCCSTFTPACCPDHSHHASG